MHTTDKCFHHGWLIPEPVPINITYLNHSEDKKIREDALFIHVLAPM